jgi:hypothetical protein
MDLGLYAPDLMDLGLYAPASDRSRHVRIRSLYMNIGFRTNFCRDLVPFVYGSFEI